jgi:hypothetical protein
LITSFVNAVLYHESTLYTGGSPARQVAAVGIYPVDDTRAHFLVTAYFVSYSEDLSSEPGTGLTMMLSFRPESDFSVDCLWICGGLGQLVPFRPESDFSVDCLWICGGLGQLVPEFQEDVDGDGVRDFMFYPGPRNNAPSFLVSGKDGSNIAWFFGDETAIGHGPGGTFVGLDHRLYYRVSGVEADPGFNVYSWVEGLGLQLVPETASETSSTGEKVVSQDLSPVAALMRHGVDVSSITIYTRRDVRNSAVYSGARLVQPVDVPGWDFWLKRPPQGAFGSDVPPDVTPQLVYVPPKFTHWWENHWGAPLRVQ